MTAAVHCMVRNTQLLCPVKSPTPAPYIRCTKKIASSGVPQGLYKFQPLLTWQTFQKTENMSLILFHIGPKCSSLHWKQLPDFAKPLITLSGIPCIKHKAHVLLRYFMFSTFPFNVKAARTAVRIVTGPRNGRSALRNPARACEFPLLRNVQPAPGSNPASF